MNNPLLHPSFPIAYDAVEPEHLTHAVDELLERAKLDLDALGLCQQTRTFKNTILALEKITEPLEFAMGVTSHLQSVATTDALREAINKNQPRVSAFFSQIPLNDAIYDQVRNFSQSAQVDALTDEEQRCLQKTLSYFKRHGAELDTDAKKRLTEIEVELTQHCLSFSQNVLDATNAFELYLEQESDLAGLPSSAIKAARQSAQSKEKPGYRFTLQAPSYLAVLKHLDDRKIREQIYRAMATRGAASPFDNRPLITSIVALRAEKAALLGYEDFADLVTEERMAGTGKRARDFIDDLEKKTRPFFDAENQTLQSNPLADSDDLAPWDIAYEAEKLRRARYDFDDESLRPYFGLDNVLQGLFDIATRLYGVTFEPWDGAPVWDESVRTFKIIDESDHWTAGIYVDVFPRENKQGGAWMNSLWTNHDASDVDWPHLGLLCANVTPAIGGQEALLTHREVETLFHEFGHLMHHCLSKAKIRSQAGTNVAWDFVELPSQIFENWCWEREALDLFAKHVETGQSMPEELFSAMKRARTYRAANGQMRQLGFAALDLGLHSAVTASDHQRDGEHGVIDYAREILERYSPAQLPGEYAMVASFGHLFGDPTGYAAAYYSYKWAEVLDADAFSRFRQEGIFNRETGQAFRQTILARGDEDDPAELFRQFMGRDPDPAALLSRLGLEG